MTIYAPKQKLHADERVSARPAALQRAPDAPAPTSAAVARPDQALRHVQRHYGNAFVARALHARDEEFAGAGGVASATQDGRSVGGELAAGDTAVVDANGAGGVPVPAPAPGVFPPNPPPPPAPAPAPAAPALAVRLPAIRGTATPAGMAANRIPPRVDTPVSVTVTGWTPPMLPITLSIEGGGGGNGTATINGGATHDVSSTGTVQLRGGTQTSPGNAGHLQLVARQGGTELARSSGFSVSSIPQDWTCTFSSLPADPDRRGFVVQDGWESDSGNVADLDEAEISEQVEYVTSTGCFSGVGANNSGYLPANVFTTDSHTAHVSTLTGVGYRLANQTSIFKDKRTGATDIPMRNSGYTIERTVGRVAGALYITTDKQGAAVTANGFRSGAGSGSVRRTQRV